MPFFKSIGSFTKILYSAFFDRPVKRLRFYVSEIESPRLPEAFRIFTQRITAADTARL